MLILKSYCDGAYLKQWFFDICAADTGQDTPIRHNIQTRGRPTPMLSWGHSLGNSVECVPRHPNRESITRQLLQSYNLVNNDVICSNFKVIFVNFLYCTMY